MKKNSCRTYFRIVGIFNPQEIAEILNATPHRIIRRGDSLPHTKRVAEHDEIVFGYNDEYSADINEMLRVTLKGLRGKVTELAALREKYRLEYYLEIVPEIESGSEEPHPALSLDDDIIEFLYLTKTKHDLDYYIY